MFNQHCLRSQSGAIQGGSSGGGSRLAKSLQLRLEVLCFKGLIDVHETEQPPHPPHHGMSEVRLQKLVGTASRND